MRFIFFSLVLILISCTKSDINSPDKEYNKTQTSYESQAKSNYNYLWVLTDKYLYKINYNGLIIFKKENKIGSKKIGFYKNDILLSNESELYHLENNNKLFTKIKLEKLFIKDFFVINETLYIYDKDHLNKYLILSN